MADAKPSRPAKVEKEAKEGLPSAAPKIEYFGEGADKVKFTIDPKAKLIRVYAGGVILVDY